MPPVSTRAFTVIRPVQIVANGRRFAIVRICFAFIQILACLTVPFATSNISVSSSKVLFQGSLGWISDLEMFWWYQNFDPIPWEIDFRKFAPFFKLRGLRPYAWVFYSQNHPVCSTFYPDQFHISNKGYLFDSTSTHAILTPVISSFSSVFDSKPYLHRHPPRRHRY